MSRFGVLVFNFGFQMVVAGVVGIVCGVLYVAKSLWRAKPDHGGAMFGLVILILGIGLLFVPGQDYTPY